MFTNLLIIFICIIFPRIHCHELLLDFTSFQDKNTEVKLSDKCSKDLNALQIGLKREEIWAIKIQDASGRSGPGFIYGNYFWLGSEKCCELLNNQVKIEVTPSKSYQSHENIASIESKFPVEYRMFYATHTSPIQFGGNLLEFVGLQIGICFPKSCKEAEIIEMSKVIFKTGEFNRTNIYGEIKFVKTKTLQLRVDFWDDPFAKVLA